MKGGKKNSPPTPPKKDKAICTKKERKRKIFQDRIPKMYNSMKEVVEGYSHDLILSSVAREKCDEGNVITRSSSTSNCDANI